MPLKVTKFEENQGAKVVLNQNILWKLCKSKTNHLSPCGHLMVNVFLFPVVSLLLVEKTFYVQSEWVSIYLCLLLNFTSSGQLSTLCVQKMVNMSECQVTIPAWLFYHTKHLMRWGTSYWLVHIIWCTENETDENNHTVYENDILQFSDSVCYGKFLKYNKHNSIRSLMRVRP